MNDTSAKKWAGKPTLGEKTTFTNLDKAIDSTLGDRVLSKFATDEAKQAFRQLRQSIAFEINQEPRIREIVQQGIGFPRDLKKDFAEDRGEYLASLAKAIENGTGLAANLAHDYAEQQLSIIELATQLHQKSKGASRGA